MVSFVIPFADVDEQRTRLLDWMLSYWQHRFPGAEFIVEAGPSEGFSKTQVLNAGISRTRGEVIVAMDADTLMAPSQLEEALGAVEEGKWALPYSVMQRLSQNATETVLSSSPIEFEISSIESSHCSEQPKAARFGAMVQVFPRSAWEDIGTFDERFVGWGQEDHCMKMALDTLLCPCVYIGGEVFHLWHLRPGERPNSPSGRNRKWPGQERTLPNQYLQNEYLQANGNPEKMRELLGRSR